MLINRMRCIRVKVYLYCRVVNGLYQFYIKLIRMHINLAIDFLGKYTSGNEQINNNKGQKTLLVITTINTVRVQ